MWEAEEVQEEAQGEETAASAAQGWVNYGELLVSRCYDTHLIPTRGGTLIHKVLLAWNAIAETYQNAKDPGNQRIR